MSIFHGQVVLAGGTENVSFQLALCACSRCAAQQMYTAAEWCPEGPMASAAVSLLVTIKRSSCPCPNQLNIIAAPALPCCSSWPCLQLQLPSAFGRLRFTACSLSCCVRRPVVGTDSTPGKITSPSKAASYAAQQRSKHHSKQPHLLQWFVLLLCAAAVGVLTSARILHAGGE